jgi:hypothetical protein
MGELVKTVISEIVTLHNEIAGHLNMSLSKAIRIGELLQGQKDSLKHGEFIPWLSKNIPFTDRTARNYMRLYQERDRLKTETVSDLTSAYKLLTEHKEETIREACMRWKHELDAFDTDPSIMNLRVEEQIKILVRIRDEALEWQNRAAEEALRCEREMGKCIIELRERTTKLKKNDPIAFDILLHDKEFRDGTAYLGKHWMENLN